MSAARRRQDDHMEAVRAVHRRSAYERAIGRLAYYDAWAHGGVPPMDEDDRRRHEQMREMVEHLRRELVRYGQMTADA